LKAARVPIVKITDHLVLSARAGRLYLWLGGAVLAIGTFARFTRELIEGEAGTFDNGILLRVAKMRTPSLTSAAMDVTALGSNAMVILI